MVSSRRRVANDMEMNLFVPGRKVVIETRVGQSVQKGESRIIGVREPDFLLLDMPTVSGSPLLTYQGEKCIVRVLNEGRIVGVSAGLQFALNRPFPMAVVQCVGDTHEIRVRQHDRVGCNFGALIKSRASAPAPAGDPPPDVPKGPELRAALIDLSDSGCQVAIPLADASGEFPTPLGVIDLAEVTDSSQYLLANLIPHFGREAFADLTFDLPEPEPGRHEDVLCETRWARSGGGSVLLVGFLFLEPSEALCNAVRHIVEYQKKFFTRPVQSE